VNVEPKRDDEMAGNSLRPNEESKEAENLKGWDKLTPREVGHPL
jgi:hypothetical protein